MADRIGMYLVWDLVGDMHIGGVQLHRHDAAAVRTFDDIARMDNSVVAKHPEDFQLLRIGYLDGTDVYAETTEVLNGKQWAAMNLPKERDQ